MRVVINGLAALKLKTGVGHHVANLANSLIRTSPANRFSLYPGERIGAAVRKFQTNSGKSTPKANGASKPSIRSHLLGTAKSAAKLASAWHFTAYTRTFGFDLYHEPNFVPFPSHLPTVVTVHDLSVVRVPLRHPADRVKVHERHFHRGLKQAAHVIVVSKAVRMELIESTGIEPNGVTAIYNGINPAFRPMTREETAPVKAALGLPDRYFLCVGTIEPRKNIITAMKAYCDLPNELRQNCPLALVGPWGWKSEADREFYESTGKARGIRHLGYVSDEQMPALFAGATGLVYPTFYEGFGLPPVEMLASGGRVLASTALVLREVCGTHADYLEPEDVSAWRDAMNRLATEPRSQERTAAVDQAGTFTWTRAAVETLAVYRKVLAESGRSRSQ